MHLFGVALGHVLHQLDVRLVVDAKIGGVQVALDVGLGVLFGQPLAAGGQGGQQTGGHRSGSQPFPNGFVHPIVLLFLNLAASALRQKVLLFKIIHDILEKSSLL